MAELAKPHWYNLYSASAKNYSLVEDRSRLVLYSDMFDGVSVPVRR